MVNEKSDIADFKNSFPWVGVRGVCIESSVQFLKECMKE